MALLAPELMARVRQTRIGTHRLVNTALSGGYRSTFRGSGLEFNDVRAYQPGDEVRRIDWNVTARTGDAFIKTYAEERELTINLIVDTSRSMDFGSGRWTKRETAAQFCSLISFVAMRHQDRVGLVMFGERPGLHLRARKGGQHVLRVVREVIAAPPSDGGSDLAAVLEHQLRALRRRSVVFLVSDFLDRPRPDGGATPPWSELLGHVRADLPEVGVGEPCTIVLEVEHAAGSTVRFREVDPIPDDSWVLVGPRRVVRDTPVAGSPGRVTTVATWRVLSLDPGDRPLSSITIDVGDASGTRRVEVGAGTLHVRSALAAGGDAPRPLPGLPPPPHHPRAPPPRAG